MQLLTIIALAFVVIGCATQPAVGELPDDETAVVHGSYWGSLRWHKAAITGYNGEAFGMRPVATLELLPGDHFITASCFSGFGPMTGAFTMTETVSFRAEAGHSYQVRCGAYGEGRTIWIEDQSTREVVGGTAPP